MFVVIAFGILALALAGAFVVWFYELFSNTDNKKERNKNDEGMRGSSFNDKLIFQEKLYNVSEFEELPMIETSDYSGKIFLFKEDNNVDILRCKETNIDK